MQKYLYSHQASSDNKTAKLGSRVSYHGSGVIMGVRSLDVS